jgi:hypothetical protein
MASFVGLALPLRQLCAHQRTRPSCRRKRVVERSPERALHGASSATTSQCVPLSRAEEGRRRCLAYARRAGHARWHIVAAPPVEKSKRDRGVFGSIAMACALHCTPTMRCSSCARSTSRSLLHLTWALVLLAAVALAIPLPAFADSLPSGQLARVDEPRGGCSMADRRLNVGSLLAILLLLGLAGRGARTRATSRDSDADD